MPPQDKLNEPELGVMMAKKELTHVATVREIGMLQVSPLDLVGEEERVWS